MKRVVLKQFLFIIFLLTFLVNCAFASDIGEAMKILPESTDFVIKFSSTKDFYQYLAVTENSFMGQTVDDINQIKENFGFNPLDLKELENNGLDASKPFGVALSDFKIENESDTPNMNFILFLPVKDIDKAVAKIKEMVEEDNPDAKFSKQGDMWSWYIDLDSSEPEDLEAEDDPSSIAAEEAEGIVEEQVETKEEETSNPTPAYMVSKNGYLFIGANPVKDAKQFFQSIGKDGKKLISESIFVNVTEKINPSKEVFIYANIGRIFSSNPDAMKLFSQNIADKSANDVASQANSFNYMKDYQGMGAAVSLKTSDLKANFIVNIVENSPLLSMFKAVTTKRDIILGLKEKPLLLLGIVENIQTYWQMMQKRGDKGTLDSIKGEFATIKTDYNIDVEKDIIQNIGNNFNLGMYDGMSINMSNLNTLAVLELKDSSKIKEAIEKVIAKLTPQQQSMINRVDINGSEVYMMPAGPVQLYAGFIGNNLTITLSKPMFEKATSAEVENGFLKGFKDSGLKTSLQQDISIFFFDVKEAIAAIKNFVPMLVSFSPEAQIIAMPEFQQIVEPFEYISAVSRVDGNSMVGDFIFKTKFDKPFFQGVQEANVQLDVLKKNIKQ